MGLRYGWWMFGAAILPLCLLLSGCAVHGQPPAPEAGQGGSMQHATRVVIHFRQATADNPRLSAAIAGACHCQPVFIRPHAADALIYEVTLPPGQDFAVFAVVLLRQGAPFGILAVEEDQLMRHQ